MFCVHCGYKLMDGANFCSKCGKSVKPTVPVYQQQNPPQPQPQPQQFNGIYKYTLFGTKKEVYCPRCRSSNCRRDSRNIHIPGKTKTTYSANLNPLKPFTFANKKEKVIRQDFDYNDEYFVCNSCGKKFY